MSREIRHALPILRANVREAVRSLVLAKQRTVLGVIGIVIGIGSIIAMISVSLIARSESLSRFQELGTDIMVVHTLRSPTSRAVQAPPVSLADAVALEAEAPSISLAAPRLRSSASFSYAGADLGRRPMEGVTASFAEVNELSVAEGRFISDFDVHRYFCVLGAELARTIRRTRGGPLVGGKIKLDGRLYTIVGVLAEVGRVHDPMSLEIRADRSAFVPITTGQRIFTENGIRTIVVRSGPGVHYTRATREILSYFAARMPHLKLNVRSATKLIEQMEKQMQLMTLLLGAVGSIALIVGGIGVMNIMLVSVAERKKEIGVRRALGAHRGDIQGQFLIESLILSLMGGVFGTALGVVGTYAICQFTGWQFSLSTGPVVLGIGVASGVGIFFGFQPAYQAARLDPIAALNSE